MEREMGVTVQSKIVPSYRKGIRRPAAYLVNQGIGHPDAADICNEVEIRQLWRTAVDMVKGAIQWRE